MKKKLGETTLESALERFLRIEKELDLLNLKIQGVYFWEYLRLKIFHRILSEAGIFNDDFEIKLKNKFRNIINSLFLFLITNAAGRPLKKDILFFSKDREVLFNDLVKNIPWSYLKINYAKNYGFNNFIKKGDLKYFDSFSFLPGIQKRIINIRFKKDEYNIIDEVCGKIYEDFGIRMKLFPEVYDVIRNRKILIKIFTKILDIYKPKLIVQNVHSQFNNMVLNEISKGFNIPVIELQHGIISKFHLSYYFPGIKRHPVTFPDYLFTFGDYWSNIIEYPVPQSNIISTGHLFNESETVKYNYNLKKNQIIFLSQETISSQLFAMAQKLEKLLPDNYRIIFKLHPREYKKTIDYRNLLNNSKKIDIVKDRPLYELFSQSKYMVGVYSTTIYEGMSCGLTPLLVDLPGIEYMADLIEKSLAVKVKNVAEIIKIINDNNQKTRSLNPDFFFKKNSIENMTASLKQIVNYNK